MTEFKSKRNRVYRSEDKVYKQFSDAAAARAEAEFLNMLSKKNVPAPALLRREGHVLVMEYIDGVTLPDLLCGTDEQAWPQIAALITGWLQIFYDAVCHTDTGEIRGDVNGRNFLFKAGKVWGVDFEEHIYGARETDAGRLLAYTATYDIQDETRKTVLANALERQFVGVMGLDPLMVSAEREKEMQAISLRRKR